MPELPRSERRIQNRVIALFTNQASSMQRWEKPDITIPEIARRLKRTPRAIEMPINRLKADEIVGRGGPAKGGHWEALT